MKRQPVKRFTLLIVITGLILFALIFKLIGVDRSIQSGSLAITQPIIQKFYGFGNSLSSLFSKPKNTALLQTENELLRDEIIQIKQRLAQLQTAEQENQSLRQLLNFFEDSSTNLPRTAARVVGKDPENSSVLLLNVGIRDGVALDNAVVVEDGVIIAKITEVFARSSKALLLTDTQSQVASTISGGAPSSKMAHGERGLSLLLDQIPQGESLLQGQLVITSGLEISIPKGLIIGEIEEVISENSDLFQKAILRPLADPSAHTFVSVILSQQ